MSFLLLWNRSTFLGVFWPSSLLVLLCHGPRDALIGSGSSIIVLRPRYRLSLKDDGASYRVDGRSIKSDILTLGIKIRGYVGGKNGDYAQSEYKGYLPGLGMKWMWGFIKAEDVLRRVQRKNCSNHEGNSL